MTGDNNDDASKNAVVAVVVVSCMVSFSSSFLLVIPRCQCRCQQQYSPPLTSCYSMFHRLLTTSNCIQYFTVLSSLKNYIANLAIRGQKPAPVSFFPIIEISSSSTSSIGWFFLAVVSFVFRLDRHGVACRAGQGRHHQGRDFQTNIICSLPQ